MTEQTIGLQVISLKDIILNTTWLKTMNNSQVNLIKLKAKYFFRKRRLSEETIKRGCKRYIVSNSSKF